MAALPAAASDRPYAFVQGAATLPESMLELESWFGVEKPRAAPAGWDWWLGPVVGLTDRLEAGLFATFTQAASSGGAPEALALSTLRLQLALALAERRAWPVDVLLRVDLAQGVGAERSAIWVWAIASRDLGRLNLTANLAGWLKFEDPVARYLEGLAGASYEVVRGVRLGAELHGVKEIHEESKLFAGPALALGRGRVWASTGFGFGIGGESPRHHGRLVLGVSL